MHSIVELKKQGNRVKVYHYRLFKNKRTNILILKQFFQGNRDEEMLHYGGQTEIELFMPDGKIHKGVAECSLKDNFNRKIGIQTALGRIIKQMIKV